MEKFQGYDEAQVIKTQSKLPVGNYILKMMDAEETTFRNGGKGLKIYFDIAEGDYKDFYANNYRNQIAQNKKWKGTYLLYIPAGNGDEQDRRTAGKFKGVMEAIEKSNPGYHWDWDEKGLKGKKIGGVFFEKEYEFNGFTGFYTACHSLVSVEAVKSGTLETPQPKRLKKVQESFYGNDFDLSGYQEIGTEDAKLPF